MGLYQKALLLGLCISFLGTTEIGALKVEDADFSSLLTTNASIINPIFGLALYMRGQQLLRNLYEYGNPEHPLIRVIRTLFHHDIESELVRPSAAEANVAYGFGPYEIGWLLALLTCHPEIFDRTPLPIAEKENKKNKIEILGKEELGNFIKKLNESHKKRVMLENPKRRKKDIRGTSTKKLFDFSEHALQAIKLGNGESYNAEFIPLLFNTFAYAKAKSKNDLCDFVINGFLKHATQKKSLKEKDKEPTKEYMTPYGKQILENKKLLDTFLKEKVSSSDIKKLVVPYYKTHMIDSLLPKALLFSGTAYLLNLIHFHSKISQIYVTQYDNSPDCAEAAILHLIAGILFNNIEGSFSAKMLPKEFHQQNNVSIMLEILKHRDLDNLSIRTIWFRFLSKRPNIAYKKGTYSLCARTSNIFELLKQLFLIEANSWEELGENLSSSDSKIIFTGPLTDDKKNINMITMKKIYPDKSYYYTTICVAYDQHAGIMESKFERDASSKNEKRVLFADKLLPIGLPEAVYGAIVPLSQEQFQLKTIPHKKNNALPLALTLSRDIEKQSFFELLRLAKKSRAIKALLRLNNFNYNTEIDISTMCTDWILKSDQYQKKFLWDFMINRPTPFIERAFFQKHSAAINFFIDTMLKVARDKSSSNERTMVKALWKEIIAQYTNPSWVNQTNLLSLDGPFPKAMSRSYLMDRKELASILKKLLQQDKTLETIAIKRKLAENVAQNRTLIKKIIDHDNLRAKNLYHFTYIYPHMLYILLEKVIQGTDEGLMGKDETNRNNCATLLLGDPAYLNVEFYRQETLCTIRKKYGNGFGIAQKLPEIKRAVAFNNALTEKIKQLQNKTLKRTILEKKENFILSPLQEN